MSGYEWIGLGIFAAFSLWLMKKAAASALRSNSNRPPWYTLAWLLFGIVFIVAYASLGNK